MIMRKASILLFAALLAAAISCGKKNADLELEAARKAIADAQSRKASDCAKETYQAAEAAIAEANRLAEAGEIESAKAKAVEAKTLAEQAAAASKPGCDEKEEEEKTPQEAKSDQDAAAAMNMATGEVLETIYFDYNDASIREDSKAVLTKVADVMRKQPGLNIEVEGHCDVRGSTEYNLHLGERRARSVEKYLTTQGVNPKQITLISYGEERPVDLGDSEGSHQKNRRAEIHKMK
jgi:peptidoglycan-associated lipoprotein